MIKYSDKQLKIFDVYENTNKNLAISASPGSGKTFTLVELLKRTPKHKKAIFLAFNKSIQQELEKRIPESATALTLHSMGYRTLLRNSSNKFKLSEIKNWILGKKILEVPKLKNSNESVYLFTVSKLVDLYRMNLCRNIDELSDVADKYNVSTVNKELENAMKLIEYLETYNKTQHSGQMLIDYVDMLWLPYVLFKENRFTKYNVVMVDECQDLNKLQFELIKRLMVRRSRFVAVGDPYQAIYAFQGADSDVFQNIMKQPNTENLPLSYSYRCGTKIVEEANKVFNFIESPEEQHKGEVKSGSIDEAAAGDMVVCRNNAPLIDAFLYLLKNQKKSIILGKDYEKGLLSVLSKIDDFTKESEEELLKQKVEELKKRGIKSPTTHESYRSLVERIYILNQLNKEFPGRLHEVMGEIFSDKSDGNSIVLSTIHKSKGMESDNIFFLMPQLIPSKYAETATEKYAEMCLKYVAITRAKNRLIYVPYL